jgi:hypothetical protein
MSIYVEMGPNMIKNASDLFKLSFIMHLSFCLCEINIIKPLH